MNILQVVPQLNVGGVETGVVDFARILKAQGHKAVVVSAGGSLVNDLKEIGAIHYCLSVNKKSIITILKTVPLLCQIIEKENIDIVHARSRVPAWICFLACLKTKKVFITTCHGYYRKHIFSYPMGWGRRVIAISNVIARHMIEDFKVPIERIRLVPRSVDLTRFKYKSPDEKRKEEFNVGIIGRLTPIKGHMYFIKAMHKASKSIPRLKVWVVGDAPESKAAYKEQVQVLTRRLALWEKTEFLGNQRDIPTVLSHLDCLVMATTTQEAFGRVIIEAQACGVPVVATRVGGVIDIIEDGITGLIVPPADPEQIAQAVVKIYKDKNLARSIAQQAREKVEEKYNLDLMAKNTLAVYEEALSNFKILIIKLSSAGDIILSTAAIRAIREKFPKNYKISLLIGEESKDIMLRCPYIDELIVCDLKEKNKGVRELFKLGTTLRRKNFDIVVDLQNNRKSHTLSFLSLAPERYGYDNKKFSFLLNHRIIDEKPRIGPVEHQFMLLKMLGIELNNPALFMWPSDKDEAYIDQVLSSAWVSSKQMLIGINVSASSRWATKNLPLTTLVKVCEELNRKDFRIVLTGTEKDFDTAAKIVSLSKGAKIINTCGKTTINQLAVLIKKCSAYLTCDSAPLHVAAAVKTPVIAFFGPTDAKRHLPPATKLVLIQKDVECSPCYKSKCLKTECMSIITAEEIIEAVEKIIKT